MYKYILALFTLIFFACSPSPKSQEEAKAMKEEVQEEEKDAALQKYPEGVEPPEYKRIEATAQKLEQVRIEPPFWWAGMKNRIVEVLIHDNLINDFKVSINHAGVNVKKVSKVQNRNYLFVELDISPNAKIGPCPIVLTKGAEKKSYDFEIKKRKRSDDRILGIDPSDMIYLIMPDRFANGDEENDSVAEMNQKGIARDKVFFRHGGDLQGIIDKLDYLEDLGVTTLWLNPVQENNELYESYHGYAVTDHYNIDARFGDNALYVKLADELHKRGMKLVMDIIHNHVGSQHWFIQDLPSEDWIHQFDEYRQTTYRAPTHMDPYASKADKSLMVDGWFDTHMPDLNQQNKHLATYLTQNNIWWVEYAGLDAYRIDTYAYPDAEFTSDWGKAMQLEYPQLGLFGETWVHGSAIQAQFTQNNNLRKGYNSHLPAVTDFQLYYAISDALSKEQGWTDGIAKIYYTLAKDFLYEDPYRNVTFLDNHDLARFYTQVGEDLSKFKSGISFLMTMRGIPMLYYGTECLFTGEGGGAFGEAGRIDFPGGWKDDKVNKFTKEGRTEKEEEVFSFIKKIANYRKNTPALHTGKLMQFVPENNIYVYFRYDKEKTVMVIMNSSAESQKVETSRYAERLDGFNMAKDVISDEILKSIEEIEIEGNSVRVLEVGFR